MFDYGLVQTELQAVAICQPVPASPWAQKEALHLVEGQDWGLCGVTAEALPGCLAPQLLCPEASLTSQVCAGPFSLSPAVMS